MVDLKGKLSADFRSMSLASLHLDFFARLGDTERKSAAQILNHFYQAAGKLGFSEKEFNRRARPPFDTPTLMTNLRSQSQFAAMREFRLIKEKLLEINPEVGMKIARLIEKNIDTPAQQPSARTTVSPGLALK